MTAHDNPLPSKLVVIAGPTAVGKTELAIELAEYLGAEIVGADSRQVYRELDIGTAKPSAEQRRRVPHHMLDVVSPDDDYDVARWKAAALGALSAIEAAGHPALVCGGTGLYLRSLTRGLFAGPAADPDLRTRLQAEADADPLSVHRRLADVDPESAARIHPNDSVRVVRALEVSELTGRPLSAWHGEHGLAERPFEVLMLEITRPPAELGELIALRSRGMVEEGLVEELRMLRERGYPREARAFAAIGYREAGQCLDGELASDDLAEAIAGATRRYAKRQRTWLRGQEQTVAVAAGDVAAVRRLAEAFLS